MEWIVWSGSAALVAAAAAAGSAAVALYPPLPRDLGGASDLDDRAEHVRLPIAGDEAIDGWYIAGRHPSSVLLFHGYGRTHHRAWRYGGFLHRAGYHVFTVDFRSSRRRHRRPTTLGHHERIDAMAAFSWLAARRPADSLGVFGESLGAAMALIVSASQPRAQAVVADCPFATADEALADSCQRWARLPRSSSVLVRHAGRWLTGFDPGATDTMAAMPSLRSKPLFFIHSGEDDRIAPEQTERLWAAAGGKDPLWHVPEAGHNEAWLRHAATYEERVLRFFDRHLLGSGPGLPGGRL